MNSEADKLRAEIATADKRIAEQEAQAAKLPPQQRDQVEHQIKKAKDGVRAMRIQLAGMQEHKDVSCPNCATLMPHSFCFCRACIREIPLKLYAQLKGAVGFHHHGKASDGYLTDIKKAVLSHLKQHSSAV